MSTIIVGESNRKSVKLDLDILLRTRLLVQANSGGGKSWLLRRLAEQLFGKVPVIIVDPEGEFATLREKFGYVLVGKGGETPADPRSAALVAHKLLELRASAVCDIYELKPQTRHNWVRLFLESLVDAPKNLWRPTIVIVDEAHVYCPEKGQGESEAYAAMQDLATRGRKRGFCAVFATPRVAKLSKNVSAEMLNRLVGQTFEDIDQDRAADLLSVPRAERNAFFKDMKVIEPGYFWALGRAIAKDRILVRVGDVQTTHPEAGTAGYSDAPPPPPEKIKSLLPKLADLPKAAEEHAKTVAELKTEVRSLKAQLRAQPVKTETKEIKVIDQRSIDRAVASLMREHNRQLKTLAQKLTSVFLTMQGAVSKLEGIVSEPWPYVSPESPIVSQNERIVSSKPKIVTVRETAVFDPTLPGHPENNGRSGTLPKGEEKILRAIAQHGCVQREQLTVLTGYKRSSRDTYLQRLLARRLIEITSSGIEPTQEGCFALGSDFEPLPTGEDLQQYWLQNLPEGEKKILGKLIAIYPGWTSREEISETTGYKRSSRDTYLQRLRLRRLLEISGMNVRANEELFK